MDDRTGHLIEPDAGGKVRADGATWFTLRRGQAEALAAAHLGQWALLGRWVGNLLRL